MPPKHESIGQGSLIESEPMLQPREFEPDERVAISSMIKWFSDVRRPDVSMVTERDYEILTPDYIRSGLYVPEGVEDKDVPQARGHVIFPAAEYKLLTVSPQRLARAAATGVRNRRSENPDKAEVERIAGRASAHALGSQIDRADKLVGALQMKQDSLATIRNELMAAKATGFFAHYPPDKVKMIVVDGETAIFEALEVCATTKGWNAEQLERAKRTLALKLFTNQPDRFRNWKDFSLMTFHYARKRKLVMMAERQRLEKEQKKYDHFLDEE